MKNLFLSLAFMLVGTFAFANTSDNSIDLNKIESLINVEVALNEAASTCSIPVFYDDGTDGSGDWGGSGEVSYEYECNTTTFWDDFFFMADNVFPGWTAIIKYN